MWAGRWQRPVASVRAFGFGTCVARSVAAPRAEAAGLELLVAGYAVTAAWTLRRALRLKGEERDRLLPVAVVAAAALLLIAAAALDPHSRPFAGDRPWVLAAWAAVGLAIPCAVAVSVITRAYVRHLPADGLPG